MPPICPPTGTEVAVGAGVGIGVGVAVSVGAGVAVGSGVTVGLGVTVAVDVAGGFGATVLHTRTRFFLPCTFLVTVLQRFFPATA